MAIDMRQLLDLEMKVQFSRNTGESNLDLASSILVPRLHQPPCEVIECLAFSPWFG